MADAGLDIGSEESVPTKDDVVAYRILFELFDRDQSGFITSQDVAAIAFKTDRDP